MRAPAVSFAHKLLLVAAVGLLACGLALPYAPAFAEGDDAPSALLASSLMDGSASVVREDVVLAVPEDDAALEPVIGSFTVDGLTFAVTEGSDVELVGAEGAFGSEVPTSPQLPSAPRTETEALLLMLPESVSYNDVEYSVTSIGAYAFYLSGVTSVELPASVVNVDDRAFRSSDVASVEVAEGSPSYSSFDGALYDAEQLSLLLIPEGKQGTVLLPKTAETASPSVFSHCPLVQAISVEEGSAAFASENGLLYTSDFTTLLRVPAGAIDITIREGCTTIAAGAMEACASLATINAPASVTSISPYLFEQQPETVMAPVAVAAVGDDAEGDSADEGEPIDVAPQLSAMVALSSADDGLLSVDASDINLSLLAGASIQPWQVAGFIVDNSVGDDTDDGSTFAVIAEDVSLSDDALPTASLQGADVARGAAGTLTFNANGGLLYLGGLHYSGTIIDMSPYQAKNSLTIYATGSSSAPAIYLPSSAQEAWFQGSMNDTVRFAWWNIPASSTTKAGVNYYADARKPGYVPTGISGSGTLSPGTAHLNLVSGGEYRITGWNKKPSHKITLDPNGETGTNYLYYWPDMGYTSSLSSTTVINTATGQYTGKPAVPTGKVFDGYWSKASGGVQYIDKDGKYTSNLPKEVGEDTTWYAHYTASTSTVSFNANGGKFGTVTTSSSKVTAAYGSAMPTITSTSPASTVPIPSVKPTATGDWEFAGYFDGTGKDAVQYYTPSGDSVASARTWDKTVSTVTLYAHWSRSIKLDFQGGSGGRYISSTATFYYKCGFKSGIGTKPNAPTDSAGASLGWDFLGYCGVQPSTTMSSMPDQYFDFDCKPTGCATNPTGDTIYAWWVKKVTLHKYANAAQDGDTTSLWVVKGGKIGYACTSSMSYNANVKEKFPATSPLKAANWAPTWSNTQGWAFDGYWSSGNDVSATQYIDKEGNGVTACPDKMPSTIYAQWAREVTLDKQGGSGGSESGTQVYVTGSSTNFPYRGVDAPTIPPGGTSSGWEFLGYCDYNPSKSPAGSVYQLIKSDGSPTGRAYDKTTLYAWWVKEVTLNKGHDKAVWGTGAKKTINALLGAPLGYVCTTTAGTESEVRAKFPNPSGLGASGWAPTRTGYEFGGYYDSSTGSTRYITASGGRGDAVPKSLGSTIYAKWYATLTFDANGGTVSMYTGATHAEDRLVNVEDYQNKESIIIYEVNSGREPDIYDPSAATQAWLLTSQAIAAFWDGSNGNNYGLRFSRPGYTPIGMTGTNPDLTTTSGSTLLVPGGTFQVQWEPKTINVTWDSNGGSEVAGTSATYSETAKVPMPASEPFLAGKKFAGWFTEKEDGKGVQVTSNTALPTSDVAYYARWTDPASITFDAGGGKMYLYTGTVSNPDELVNLLDYQGMEGKFAIYETGTGGTPAILATGLIKRAWLDGHTVRASWWDDYSNNYGLRFERAGYAPIGLTSTDPELTTSSGQVNLVVGNYCTAQWRPNRYTVTFDANGADAAMPDEIVVDYEQGAKLPGASGQGFMFRGWNTKADGTGDPYQPGDACDTLTQIDGVTVTLYAQWTPIVSADAPLDVTVSVDLLGIEDQVPASGYIESRSGGALKVAAIDFTPLDGATALFGSSVSDVALEALAGERATSADVSFSLDAKATEADATKLAAFALPDGFGTKIPIGYRFAIPEDVLASIDPARFEQATTPVCSVYYTVALAS